MGESRAKVEAETVERVARLVTTAGATLKEKKRPIKVVARDGTVKKVVPHVEVIEGLLHHEGISGELQAGVRPKTILCAVCRCVVEVKASAPVPIVCPGHRGKKPCPRGCGTAVDVRTKCCRECRTPVERRDAMRQMSAAMTPEKRSAAARKRIAAMTPEERSELARKANAAKTLEQRRAAAHKGNAKKTPEQRSAATRKANATRTPQQRSEAARKRYAAMTSEKRDATARKIGERLRKAWETRRAKKAAAEKAGEE